MSLPDYLVLREALLTHNCPLCDGHEKVSPAAMEKLAEILTDHVLAYGDAHQQAELLNIRNAILANLQHRITPHDLIVQEWRAQMIAIADFWEAQDVSL